MKLRQDRADSHGRQEDRGHFDLSPIRHPGWWLALAVLIVNDHLLKGAGVLPGWLTGKLSDFAFLIVAPILVSSLLPLRLPGRRRIAFASVVGLFMAAKLSPAVSDALVSFLSRFGLKWRLWPDVSDLSALAVLPAAWWITREKFNRARFSKRRLLESVGVVAGALACIATSPALPDNYSEFIHPYFVNDTAQSQAVTFTWLFRPVSCHDDLAQVAASLTREDLDDPRSATLTSGQAAPLDYPSTAGARIAGVCSNWDAKFNTMVGDCAAVIVAATGGPTVLLSSKRRWWKEGYYSTCSELMAVGQDHGPEVLVLTQEVGKLVFKAGSDLRTIEVNAADLASRSAPSPGCRIQRDHVHTLISDAASCAVDTDCQVLSADITIPGDILCSVYVNRSLVLQPLIEAKTQWNQQCTTFARADCTAAAPLPAPACIVGRCGPR